MHGRAITPSPIHSRRPALLAVGGSFDEGGDEGGDELMQVSAGAGRNVTPEFSAFYGPMPRETCASLSRTRDDRTRSRFRDRRRPAPWGALGVHVARACVSPGISSPGAGLGARSSRRCGGRATGLGLCARIARDVRRAVVAPDV